MRALPFLLITAHTLLSPYTKVEESFTLHAVRDVLVHGSDLGQYDHLTHPGPLPRSFIPPLLLAAASKPVIAVLNWVVPCRSGVVDQVIIRLVLGLANAAALTSVFNNLQKTVGKPEAAMWMMVTGGQFHALFWAGRTVPNSVALVGTTLALSHLIRATAAQGKRKRHIIIATALLALTASIVRAETALLLAGVLLATFIKEWRAGAGYRLTRVAAVTTVPFGIAGATASILVDGYFWSHWLRSARALPATGLHGALRSTGFGSRWVWPELWGLVFNVVEGKSELWGTSPWYTYLFPYLPKLLLSVLPLAMITPLLDRAAWRALKGWKTLLGLPVLVMVAGMSCLGHKEWRFIVYVVPWVNALAAISCGQIWRARHRHSPTFISRLLLVALVGGMIANVLVTAGLSYVSHYNYPGGKAMEALHEVHRSLVGPSAANQTIRVFLPPGPRMTGASSFTQLYAPPCGYWEYNTTESPALATPEQIWDAAFDYVVTDELGAYAAPGGPRWTMIRAVEGFAGVERRKGFPPVGIRWRDEVGVFARVSATDSELDAGGY